MDRDEEQPVATAFRDGEFDILWELVYDEDIFWGTIPFESEEKTKLLRRRNNSRIEAVLRVCIPTISEEARLVIANYLHLHF